MLISRKVYLNGDIKTSVTVLFNIPLTTVTTVNFETIKMGKSQSSSLSRRIHKLVILMSLQVCLFSLFCRADPEISQGTLITKPHLRSWENLFDSSLTSNPLAGTASLSQKAFSSSSKLFKRSPFAPSRSYSFGLGKKSLTPSLESEYGSKSNSITYDNTPVSFPDTSSSSQQQQHQHQQQQLSYLSPSQQESLNTMTLPSSQSSSQSLLHQQTSPDDVSSMESGPSSSSLNSNRMDSLYQIQSPGSRLMLSSNRARFPRRPNLYSFGLGKRGWLSSIPLPSPVYFGDIKRKYSFGLGKRSSSREDSRDDNTNGN